MRRALDLAKKSEPKPTNYRVGALMINLSTSTVSCTGYTLELPGNTHAEQCCLLKLSQEHGTTEEGLSDANMTPHALYTTVEPCSKRLSGNMPCVERILRQKEWIKKVYVGVTEPDTFVTANSGRKMLQEAGIEVIHVGGLEADILAVATAGHVSEKQN